MCSLVFLKKYKCWRCKLQHFNFVWTWNVSSCLVAMVWLFSLCL